MWQRIQTLYFGLCVVFLTIMLTGDICTDFEAGIHYRFCSKVEYAVLGIAGLACNAIAMVCFKRRPFQLRLAAIGGVLILGLQVWIAADYFRIDSNMVFRWTAIVPLVCAFFDAMAIRGIFADELLVRSSKRLRAAKNKTTQKH